MTSLWQSSISRSTPQEKGGAAVSAPQERGEAALACPSPGPRPMRLMRRIHRLARPGEGEGVRLSVDAAGEGVAAVSTPQERGAAAAPRRAAAAALRGRPAGVSRERGA
jgi:hypothetical protein